MKPLGIMGRALFCFFLFLPSLIASDIKHQPEKSLAADIILKNGKIFLEDVLTNHKNQPFLGSIAIRAGTILAIGTNKEIEKYSGPLTRTFDVNQKHILPGFNDSHTHILEGAFQTFSDKLNKNEKPSMDDWRKFFLAAQNLASRYGITSISGQLINHDVLSIADQVHLIEDIFKSQNQNLRISLWAPLEQLDSIIKLRDKLKHSNSEFFQIGCLHKSLDTSFKEKTIPLISKEDLTTLVLNANRQSFPVCLEASGEDAISYAAAALSNVRRQLFNSKLRNRIEKLDLAPQAIYSRLSSLGTIAVMFPASLSSLTTEDRKQLQVALGDKQKQFLTWKRILNEDKLSFGSDWPKNPLNPWIGISQAVHHSFQSSESLNLLQALNTYTLGSAYATHEDHIKGSIREGKLADLVVVTPNKDLEKTTVFMTIVNGKTVYSAF